jgi:sorbitol/mannitol transport system permease protein
MIGQTRGRKITLTVVAYVVTFIMFFPILWMILTAFKTEANAISIPPHFLFTPTLESFKEALIRGNYFHYALNSAFSALGSTAIGLVLAIPAAYSMAFYPSRRTDLTMLWMISTKFIPAVGVLVPIYIIYKDIGLLDNIWGLIAIYTAMNLPIIVWMIYTYFKDIPVGMHEASQVDGANTWQILSRVILPVAIPGIASTCLLVIILAWNEAFWSINITNTHAATLPVFIASFKTSRGLFWAKMSAASVVAVIPIMIFGWIAQRQLVRGLTFGAVK